MSLLTKDNAKEHCRTCLKRLIGSTESTFGTYTNDIPDNKELHFNICSDAELQQLICMYVDDDGKLDASNWVIQNYPENVCLACYNKLHNFSIFRKRARKSAEKLRTVLNCSSGIIKVEINYEEDDSKQLKYEPLQPPVLDEKLQFKDALMENEEVFFEASVAHLADAELNTDTRDPFGPLAPSTSECSVKGSISEDDIQNEDQNAETHEKIKCTQCNQCYFTSSELEAHVRKVHNGNKLPFSCGHCDKEYRYIRSLKEHMKQKHQDVLNEHGQFKCDLCPKAFPTQISLKKHMCFHIKEDMARVCGICSKRFPIKNLLVEHLRTHSNDGRIPCSQCDKSFMWYQDLLNHERSSHLKEKPYPCKLCDTSFQTQKSLRFHSYRHSGEKPYLCDVCGKDFRQPTALKQHRLKHFKDDTIEKS